MKQMIEIITRALVDKPENVSVTEIGGKKISIMELKVDKTDIGKVVGKHGRTANALRTILNAASVKLKKRVLLEIVE